MNRKVTSLETGAGQTDGQEKGRALGALLGSEIAAKLIQFCGSMILARLYAPNEFGLFGIYFAVATIAATVGNLALHRAIPLPQGDLRAAALVILGACATLSVTAISILLLLITLIWPSLAPNPAITLFLLISLPLGILGWAATPVMQMSLTRAGWFRTLALTKIGQVTTLISLQAVLGVAKTGSYGLALGDAIGRLATVMMVIIFYGRAGLKLARRLRWNLIRKTLYLYRRFPLVVAPTLLLQVVPFSVMPLAIGYGIGETENGYWIQAIQVYNAFFAVSVAISPYFYRSWSTEVRETGKLTSASLWRPVALLSCIGGVPAILLAAAGPELFAIVFGERWTASGEIAQILAPALFFQTIGGTILLLLTVLRRESWNIILAIIWASASVALGISILTFDMDIITVCRLYAMLTGLVYAVYVFLSWWSVKIVA